jgi:hypothetical protein
MFKVIKGLLGTMMQAYAINENQLRDLAPLLLCGLLGLLRLPL